MSTTPDVYRAIVQVAKEISKDGISKASQNVQQGYKFRGIDDVYNSLSALLAGADLCILPKMVSRHQEERVTAKGGTLFYVTVEAEFQFVSARDGSMHPVTMFGEAMDSGDKATNKAMSAAYKYACMQAFCIPTEGMADADQQTHNPLPGPNAAQMKVAEQKLAAASKATDMEKKLDESIDLVKMRKSFAALLAEFDKIGRAERYYQEMAFHGFEDPGQMKNLKQAREIYKQIGAIYSEEKHAVDSLVGDSEEPWSDK